MHRAYKHRPDVKRQSAQIQHSKSAHETAGKSNTRSSLGAGAAREEAAHAIKLLAHPRRARAAHLLRGEGSGHDCCGVYRGTNVGTSLQLLKYLQGLPQFDQLVHTISVSITMPFYSSFNTNPHNHVQIIEIYFSKFFGGFLW